MEIMEAQSKVILHCMPPAQVYMPSAALNILKSVLKQNHFDSEIIYWNIIFENFHSEWHLLLTDEFYELSRVLPFIFSLTQQYNDPEMQKSIVRFLRTKCKENRTYKKNKKSGNFLHDVGKTFELLSSFIKNDLNAYNFSNVLLSGFSAKFYQWISALQVAEISKKLYPEIKTVIGGFDSKASAAEMMKISDCFDFAVWGEGEYPLLELATTLSENNTGFENISGLVFRDAERVIISEKRGRRFFNLDKYPQPDFDDFFSIAAENKDKGEYLFYPVESNRGCSWNRCKFCVLANGYKYRERDVDTIVDEIELAIKKYNCGYFQFLDNNVIGSDMARFNGLLDKLTKFFIESENDFCFFAEIIPYGLNADLYKRLALAGFRMVQIGGESFSDSLIRKMNKKNSFSDNLLGYKCCIKYGIRAEGSNIITGIPGETTDDVEECIANIPFVRFFTGNQLIKFDESPFSLEKLSKFYKELKPIEIDRYQTHFIYGLLPTEMISKMNRFEIFSFKKHPVSHAALWKKFFNILESYYNSPLSYKIFRYKNSVVYEEFNNKVKVVSLVFDLPEQWEILVVANNHPVSFSYMFETIHKKFRKITTKSLKTI